LEKNNPKITFMKSKMIILKMIRVHLEIMGYSKKKEKLLLIINNQKMSSIQMGTLLHASSRLLLHPQNLLLYPSLIYR